MPRGRAWRLGARACCLRRLASMHPRCACARAMRGRECQACARERSVPCAPHSGRCHCHSSSSSMEARLPEQHLHHVLMALQAGLRGARGAGRGVSSPRALLSAALVAAFVAAPTRTHARTHACTHARAHRVEQRVPRGTPDAEDERRQRSGGVAHEPIQLAALALEAPALHFLQQLRGVLEQLEPARAGACAWAAAPCCARHLKGRAAGTPHTWPSSPASPSCCPCRAAGRAGPPLAASCGMQGCACSRCAKLAGANGPAAT